MLYSGLPNSPVKKKATNQKKSVAAVAEKVPPTEKVLPVHEVAHQLLGNKPDEVEVEPVVDDSEEEYTEEVEEEKVGAGKKKLVWENYTKKDFIE